MSVTERSVDVVVVCAMEEEARPFLDALESSSEIRVLPSRYRGPATFHDGRLHGFTTVVATTGIGMTNASVAMTAVLTHLAPQIVIVAGTAGGLGEDVGLDQVMVASSALYHDADATGFGYASGQIPRMPEAYFAHSPAVEAAIGALSAAQITVRQGTVSSSNSFVSANQVAKVRKDFPHAISADMETAAIAQVCWTFNCPWISLRAVSDLCDADEFSERAPNAYKTSFNAASALLRSQSEIPLF